MALVTATTVYRESFGSLTGIIINCNAAGNTDSIAIGTSAPYFVCVGNTAGASNTTLNAGSVAYSTSSSTATIICGASLTNFSVLVLGKF
jgi:hypothetical protein